MSGNLRNFRFFPLIVFVAVLIRRFQDRMRPPDTLGVTVPRERVKCFPLGRRMQTPFVARRASLRHSRHFHPRMNRTSNRRNQDGRPAGHICQ